MISRGQCNLYCKNENYALIYTNMYISSKIKTYWRKINKENVEKLCAQNLVASKKIIHRLKINGCAICGYSKCDAALEFHHTNPEDKKFQVTARTTGYKKIVEELNKCILLCANCHREIHWGE